MSRDEISFKPPNKPWIPLNGVDDTAAIAYYISDSMTKVPIRDVTNRNDPKADPNVETKTFGLFSYCHKQMRKSMVDNDVNLLFFCTRRLKEEIDEVGKKTRKGLRVLTGYYRIGWFYEVDEGDYMLVGKEGKFVYPGFPLEDLTEYLRGDNLDSGFEQWKILRNKTPELLLKLFNQTPDSTKLYLQEIKQLEKYALDEYGFMYRKRKKGFSWEDAPKVMKLI
jgi:hypothetical protein